MHRRFGRGMTGEPVLFGTTLRRQRLAAGVTQEQLAELAGLSVRGIQDLERGARRVPHAETVRRLATALEQLDGGLPATVLAQKAAQSRLSGRRRPPPLNVPLSSFVGREEAVANVTARLDAVRLLTLTGSGGIGKTRLALQVASRYAAEVYFADLSALVDADLVVECVATALGLREQLVRPLTETVCEALADQPARLVVDNCEHVLPACVALVDILLRRCRTHQHVLGRADRGASGRCLPSPQPLSPTEARILTAHLGAPRPSAPVGWELDAAVADAQAYLAA
jgi:transcriptional regulator with XRE-family HTH domain